MTAILDRTDALASSLDLSHLTPLQLLRLDEALAGVGVLTFREYMSRANPKYVWYPHCERIASVLQRVADRELSRVLFLAPPRTGKSEPISRVFPSYWLYRYAAEWVGLTSYTANLAIALSKRARANYVGQGSLLAEDSSAASEWMTEDGGGRWAAGFGGSMLGKGMHLGIVDDPIKNAEEANSELIALRNQDFWTSTFRTRLEPNGAIVVVLQRWPGRADFVQQLFALENGDVPERWHVVCLEGEKEAKDLDIPASCTLEPDPRAPGEALCPERLSPARMRQMREQSPYFFAAQVQQRPRPREGVMFPRDTVKIVAAAPVECRRVRYWDKAGTEDGGKYTAGVRIGLAPDGIIYIEDVQRAQHEALARRRLMRTTAELDGAEVHQKVEREPGSSGKDSAADDVRNLAGFPVTEAPASGDKFLRADPLASQWQAGNVRIVRGPWNKAYLDEMEAAMPGAKFLDQMDASSGAYNELANNQWWMI
jgi:predicted phage terminase large subunit-like protein